MIDDDENTSNAAIAGSDTADGVCGSAAKSVCTLTFCCASAAFAPDGSNTPGSSVEDAARMARDAPSTDTNSYTLPPCATSPSTSKNVVYIRPNGGICVSVPARTNVKSNSAARKIVVVPSTHVAFVA